jgi:hypothetical protein
MNGYQKSIQILKEWEKKKRQGAKYGEEQKDGRLLPPDNISLKVGRGNKRPKAN